MKQKQPKHELLTLMNVGPATLKDLHLLGIERIDQLKKRDALSLYAQLNQLTGTKHDPCAEDVFAAIIHEANTGEKVPWFYFSKLRKASI